MKTVGTPGEAWPVVLDALKKADCSNPGTGIFQLAWRPLLIPLRCSCTGGLGEGLPQAGPAVPSPPPGRSSCWTSGSLAFLLASFLNDS